jgi:hypothetical protein
MAETRVSPNKAENVERDGASLVAASKAGDKDGIEHARVEESSDGKGSTNETGTDRIELDGRVLEAVPTSNQTWTPFGLVGVDGSVTVEAEGQHVLVPVARRGHVTYQVGAVDPEDGTRLLAIAVAAHGKASAAVQKGGDINAPINIIHDLSKFHPGQDPVQSSAELTAALSQGAAQLKAFLASKAAARPPQRRHADAENAQAETSHELSATKEKVSQVVVLLNGD